MITHGCSIQRAIDGVNYNTAMQTAQRRKSLRSLLRMISLLDDIVMSKTPLLRSKLLQLLTGVTR